MLPLPNNNGMLKLTTADFYVPSGRAMEPGIEPDILVSQSADMEDNTTIRNNSVVRPNPGQKYDDFQLSYALDRLNAQ
jgi:carboxyl-terminal processing protease